MPVTEQIWPVQTLPVVSVFNWVYNHVDYIRESIESILVQKTTFPIEIIIHDDASNDGTADIIKEYERKYPHLFRNILHTENQWSQGKSVMTPLFEKPKGKYLALTHGDDYWTDPHKLQKQVDFLETNPKYSSSITLFNVLETDTIKPYYNPIFKIKNEFNTKDIIENWFTQTATLVFKKEILNNLPEFYNFYQIDFTLLLLISLNGNIKLIPEFCSVYRNHNNGISKQASTLDNDLKLYYKRKLMFQKFNDFTQYKYEKSISYNLNYTHWYLLVQHKNNTFGKIYITLKYFFKIKFFSKLTIKSNLVIVFPILNKLK